MLPILLRGQERPLTKIKYNREGDLLFSASKDKLANVWYSHNGERIGTFDGHNGTIWDLDVDYHSKRLLTASGDGCCFLWEVMTGKNLFKWDMVVPVLSVAWAMGDQQALIVTDSRMGRKSSIHIVKIAEDSTQQTADAELIIAIPDDMSKVTIATWGDLNAFIVAGHENGTISIWDPVTGALIESVTNHTGRVQDLQMSKDKTFFVTASKDNTAHIYDSATRKHLKTFKTDRPVNSASPSPIRNHLVIGGGQDAMGVTTTSARQGKFEARIFHLVFEEEIARIKGHFGPINTLAFHPEGRGFASGGEDGYIRLHHFDPSYFKFKYDGESLRNTDGR
ncbi:hypothetical protein CXG81DRAFT_29547 [Caulochytrium protostelioides]|uniref:Eukaryotic translation initiation factor 3 subunit I n=1 Tax=Caulochytrium protostelioides TaxID=1555241 RepID=A0A4P9XAC4_9FUNG|nr:hypothetical protein CXG81DRAFT_29547 [Caulochytrium protostelioides]|eukprot:RKP02297.1 hypothetical protein CXG81DRAFT_29547 [Caulochytrium protostelioides]